MIKKFFLKRFRSYFTIMFLPIAFVVIVTGYFIISAQLKSLDQKGEYTLTGFDENIEASLYNFGYQLDIMMSNSTFSLSLKNLLSNSSMEQKDQSFHQVLTSFLSSYELSHDYIYSIYLYIDNRSRFMTSSGQIINIFNNSYYDMDWFLDYRSMEEEQKVYSTHRWIQRNTFDEPLEIISVYYKNTYLDGVTVINIDKSKYGALLRNMQISDKQKIFLFNNNGDVLCATDQTFETMDSKNKISSTISDYIKNDELEKIDRKWIKISDKYYYINSKFSESMNIYLISAISIDYLFLEMRFYLLLSVLVLFIVLIIITLLAYSYTKRSFYYIEQCIEVFSNAEQGKKVEKSISRINDEYDLLLNNIIYMHIRSNQVQLELLEKQHLYEMTQIMALQLQINPHFIFNTLQIMDIEVLRNLGEKSTLHKIIQQLSMVIKYALTTPTVDVTLEEELTYLKAYLEIQNIRFDSNDIVYFDIDDDILKTKVFRILLQPVLENSFCHGRRPTGEKLVIKIKIYDKGEKVSFSVIDNGKGMDRKTLLELRDRIVNDNSKSIGLTNLNRRLCLKYGQDSALNIRSKKDFGTVVSFVIPKQIDA